MLIDKLLDRAQGECLAAEQNLGSEILDALRSHSQFYGDPAVMRLLLSVQAEIDKMYDESEEAKEDAFNEGKKEGVEETREDIKERLEDLSGSIDDLIEVVEAGNLEDAPAKADVLRYDMKRLEKEYGV